MKILREMFWDSEKWRITISAGFAGITVPTVGDMLGLTFEDYRFWIILIPLASLTGLAVTGVTVLIRPIDRSNSAPTGISRKAVKWMAIMDVVFLGMFLVAFIFDRTFWPALVGIVVCAMACGWSLWMLLDNNRWDDEAMPKSKPART